MKKTFLVLLIILCFNRSFSQKKLEQFKDSIENLALDKLPRVSYKYLYKNKYKSEIKIISAIISKNLAANNFKKNEISRAYRALYLDEFFKGNFEKSIEYTYSSKKAAQNIGDFNQECLSNIMLAESYFELGDYDASLQYHLEGLKIATEKNITNLKIASKGNIGSFKLARGDYYGAIEILLNKIEETEKSNQEALKGFYPETFSNLTLAYLKTGNLEKATYYNDLAKEYSKKHKYYLNVNLFNEALIEIEKKDYKKGLALIEKSKNLDLRNHHKFKLIAQQHLAKGKIYFLQKEYKNALEELLLLEKLENNKRIHHLNFQEGFSYIAKTYSQLGKNNLSLKYYKKALNTFSNSERKKVALISEITNKYDQSQIDDILKNKNLSETKFIHNKHIQIEKEIQKLNLEQNKKNNYLFLIIGVFIILIATSSIFLIKIRKRNKEKLELLLAKVAKNETKKSIVNTTFKIKDAEINRIIDKLNQLEKEQFYLKTDCTANSLSKKLETNTTYLSKIINSYYQKSFSKYINDLRIEYVLERLKNDKLFRRYSIQSIANEIGFKSRESFNKIFKNETGLLPSYFIKELDSKLNT